MNTKKQFICDDFKISQETADSGWTMPYAHCHAAHEIYILESGKRTVTIDDIECEVNAHDVTMFLPNHPHRSRGDVPFSEICIHFSE